MAVDLKTIIRQMNELGVGDSLLRGIGLEYRRSVFGKFVGAVGIFSAGVLIGAGLGLLFAPMRGDELRLVLGSGGSKRIRTALLQVISLFVDRGLPIDEIIAHPRLHWDGEAVQAEPGFPPASLAALRAQRPVNEWTRQDVYFGGVHAAVPRGEGAGDARRGGCALVVDTS